MVVYTWHLDQPHSDVKFKIRHLIISSVNGIFNEFSGTVKTAETYSFDNAVFNISINVFSIDTYSTERDEQLKSEDFFNADMYPEIRFSSDSFIHLQGDKYKLSGSLTVKKTTRPFTFDVLFGGYTKDGFGLNRAIFTLTGSINRNDFDIHDKDTDEAGTFILGEDIELHATLNFTLNPEETHNYS